MTWKGTQPHSNTPPLLTGNTSPEGIDEREKGKVISSHYLVTKGQEKWLCLALILPIDLDRLRTLDKQGKENWYCRICVYLHRF